MSGGILKSPYRKKSTLAKAKEKAKEYLNPWTFFGSAVGSGALYVGGLIVGFTRDLLLQELPYMLNGGNIQQGLASSAAHAYAVAGEWGLYGTVLGIIASKYIADYTRELFGGKKERR